MINKIVNSPFKQLACIGALAIILMLLSELQTSNPYSSITNIRAWVVLLGMILFFALMNSIMSFAEGNGNKYWMQSIISYAILLIVGGIIAWQISGVGIYEAGSVSWIYLVFTFGYLVLLSIVNLIKFLLKLAQKSEGGDKF